jgi:hypothetical protein
MLIGAFAPWAKSVGLLNVSINGTDGQNDGWAIVGLAIGGAGALLLYRQKGRLWALGTLAAGALGALVTIYDRGNITDLANENESEFVALQVGWGLNLSMGASIALAVVGAVALLGNQSAPGMRTAEPAPPAQEASEPTVEAPAASSTSDEIENLAALRSRGVLTDEEFCLAKQRLLSGQAVD